MRIIRRRRMAMESESYAVIHNYEPVAPPAVVYPAGYGTTEQTNYVTYDAVSGQYVQTTTTTENVTYQQPATVSYQQVAPIYSTGGATTIVSQSTY